MNNTDYEKLTRDQMEWFLVKHRLIIITKSLQKNGLLIRIVQVLMKVIKNNLI